MHSYSTDSKERMMVPLYLAVVSILSAWLLSKAVDITHFSVPWWLDAPAVVGFYTLYQKWFDTMLWKNTYIRKCIGIKVPDLNGTWIGHLASSYDQHSTQREGRIVINQTWTTLSIRFGNEISKSRSIMGAIHTSDPDGVEISYEYQSDPGPNAVDTMHIHRGFTKLNLSNDGRELEGTYFTGRGRLNHGSMRFTKQ